MKLLFTLGFAQAEGPNNSEIALRNEDDTVQVSGQVIHEDAPVFANNPARMLQFAEMLKQKTGADFLELSSLTRGTENTEDASFGQSFEFVMGFHGRFTKAACNVASHTEASDDQCQFWDAQGRLIPSDLVHFFQVD